MLEDRGGTGRSIAEALDEAAGALERAGVPSPRREATALWAAVEGVTPGDVWLKRAGAPPGPVARRFWEVLGRRASGIPFPYAVGCASFRTVELKLDPRALIPRPETEGLVELVLKWARRVQAGTGHRQPAERGPGAWGVAADIGTGSGCVALALALEGRFERVLAVERSAGAAALARENVALVRPPVPVEVVEGDLLAPLARRSVRCRVIAANPPYLTAAEYAALDPAVRRFEPREALVSGRDGLEATRALFAGARAVLEPGGLLAVEIDERRADAVCALARQLGWRGAAIHNDVFGRPRYAVAIAGEGSDA